MVAVHRGGDGGLGETSGHELKDGHLGGGVLACDALIKVLTAALGLSREVGGWCCSSRQGGA
jgi:hypothetical protein